MPVLLASYLGSHCLIQGHRDLCLFSKRVRVLPLIFRSLIHFELVFVYGVRWGSNFVLCMCRLLVSAPPVESTLATQGEFLSTLTCNQLNAAIGISDYYYSCDHNGTLILILISIYQALFMCYLV